MSHKNKFLEYKVDIFEKFILSNFKENLIEKQVQKWIRTYSQETSPTNIQSPSLSSYVRTYYDPLKRSFSLISFSISLPRIPWDLHLLEIIPKQAAMSLLCQPYQQSYNNDNYWKENIQMSANLTTKCKIPKERKPMLW